MGNGAHLVSEMRLASPLWADGFDLPLYFVVPDQFPGLVAYLDGLEIGLALVEGIVSTDTLLMRKTVGAGRTMHQRARAEEGSIQLPRNAQVW